MPYAHLQGQGCPNCAQIIRKQKSQERVISTEEFIKRAKEIHSDKYDYSLTDCKKNNLKVLIICRIHGLFEVTAASHLRGHNCFQCDIDRRREVYSKSLEQFIKEAKKLHKDKYDYSLVDYKNCKIKVKIICKKCGLVFEVTPLNHLYSSSGCPYCNFSKGEQKIKNFLNENGIDFTSQYTFPTCKSIGLLRFDFYVPDYNLLIEFQGKQHFQKVSGKWNDTDESFQKRQTNDKIKRRWATSNKYNFLEIRYDEDIDERLKTTLKI